MTVLFRRAGWRGIVITSRQGTLARYWRITEFPRSVPQRLGLLLLVSLICTLRIAPAHALPAACSAPGNFCTAPEIAPWVYFAQPGYGIYFQNPYFASEHAVVAALTARMVQGTGWCTVTPTSVTRDDNLQWGGTPQYFGNIDVMHGNTAHFDVTGYESDCSQSWQYNPGIRESRYVTCPEGMTVIYDTGVTPSAPFCLSTQATFRPSKARGNACPKDSGIEKGNPCDVTNGNKHQTETDYRGSGTNPLTFVRTYNSLAATEHYNRQPDPLEAIGIGWTATYFQRISVGAVSVGSTTHQTLYAFRPDGRVLMFNWSGSDWVRVDEDIGDRVISTATGYEYRSSDNTTEVYDAAGRLTEVRKLGAPAQVLTYAGPELVPQAVQDAFGHSLTFSYTLIAYRLRLTTIADPAGQSIILAYDQLGQLTSVQYPDTKTRVYGYGNNSWLTSLTDEQPSVYSRWTYHSYWGHVLSSEHANGIERYTFDSSGGTRWVTDPLGVQRTYSVATNWGVNRLLTANSTCNGCSEDKTRTYDANGNPSTRTDFNNVQSTYAYDLTRNLETSRTEAYGTPNAHTLTTHWHATYRLPTQIDEPGKRTTFTHDANGNVLTKTELDTATSESRTWTYTYNSFGQVLTADGPRTDVSDVTTFTYYSCTTGFQCGQLQTITNAAGHVTTYTTYNGHGQPLTITDPNGVVTTLTYDLRQRLTSRIVGSEQTSFEYWPTGLLKKATLPDGSYLEYTYDAAHRLTDINDSEGNRVHYTLNTMGNRTNEELFDPSNAMTQTRSRVFNTLNQLWKEIGATGTAAVATTYGFDNNGNQTSIAAPLGRNTANVYDELNRLTQVTDPAAGITRYGFNALDQLISVTDPRNKITSYSFNALGDLKGQVSPDTGTTNNTFDSAGNLQTSTDARGKTATYAYDALNRVTSITYPDQTIGYVYDTGSNQKGRLRQINDDSGSTSWTFDPQGRATTRAQNMAGVIKSVAYGHDLSGRLQTLTLPSGNFITYGYTNGKITSLTLNGSTTILSNALYQPFGPTTGWTWGNGTLAIREYDQDGKITDIDSAGLRSYLYDDAFRITGITDASNANLSQNFGFDLLDRLTSATGGSLDQSWTYDANGNRLTQGGSSPSTYTVSSASNRLTSVSGALTKSYGFDSAGNITSDGSATFLYNDAGRMISATKAGVTTIYSLNGLGQRVRKTAGGASIYFVYDEAGHLLGEYDNAGTLIQETIWFEDIPVVVLKPNGSGGVNVFYLHTDHLNIPRRISRPSDNVVVWRWDSDPFGTSAANEDPDGDSNLFTYNLRFPGQYLDTETGLHYNYFRDYDPATGRYPQSDPIGLRGGLNTYAYARTNPLSRIDPLGLADTTDTPWWDRPGIPGLPPMERPPGGWYEEGWLKDWLKDVADGAQNIWNWCTDKKCPPCKFADGTIVPVGTIGYRFDMVPPSKPHYPFPGSHYNLYVANQNPNNCQCFWQPDGASEVMPPGAIPIQPFAN